MEEDRKKALSAALTQIERQFGKGAIMRMGDTVVGDIEVVSTGSLQLDAALGVGGLPRGRVVEIYGPEASGKTTFSNHVHVGDPFNGLLLDLFFGVMSQAGVGL